MRAHLAAHCKRVLVASYKTGKLYPHLRRCKRTEKFDNTRDIIVAHIEREALRP